MDENRQENGSENGRGHNGRFVRGGKPGPGRPRKALVALVKEMDNAIDTLKVAMRLYRTGRLNKARLAEYGDYAHEILRRYEQETGDYGR
jgi:hypothetical protein